LKINVNDISGYAEMTAEEKVAALEAMEVTDTDTERKYKDLISKANSEAKKYKDAMREAEDRLKGHMTEEERLKQEQEDRYKAIEEENLKLKRDMTISQKTAFYQSIGFDEELAKETATAFVDGDFDTVEANQKKAHEAFETALRQSVREETVRSTPHPTNNSNTNSLTKEQIMKEKDAIKRQRLIAENMHLFI